MQFQKSIFNSDWWLDATCGKNNWSKITIENKVEIPYHIKKKAGFNFLLMPPLTPWFDFEIHYPDGQKRTSKISFEKEIITEFIEKLPNADYYQMQFAPSLSNIQPFLWKDFKESVRYTYFLETTKTEDELFADFKENIRREIKKATEQITINEDLFIDNFYKVYSSTIERNSGKTTYKKELIATVFDATKEKKQGKILTAFDKDNNIHASIFIVWDSSHVHYLLGGTDLSFRNSGAMSLLLWEAIKFAKQKELIFNFEGSMIEPVERFFRAFGGEQISYFKLEKYNSSLLKVGNSLFNKL